ncbi:hypothetical protein SAMN04489729_3258 [Amycolatopsis lurida]|uniref:Uncharacterized protein n=1 Tax=Amycolatopsis lurida NRRL 2430 TaxID=1460371 RepID=A0A2P2FJJ8_AMYLU|nr:hypothetical protein [Amycolatopsis lurida]KFU76900.1 hypothetical protein BB31_33730 [Amycolatopsis lurida NRRL 2430]SED06576.1 hypothetical protein SAMN04489729_3258 [Amycolatopsis lurida]
MWAWLIGGYAVFVAGLIGYATHFALSLKDKDHRADACKVLKLLWGAVADASSLVALLWRLYEAGVIL